MMKFIDDYTYKAGKRLEIKIGVHYGQCIFGVLGYHKPQFSLIGDTINTTSRHCTTGKNGNIVLSEACWNEVKASNVVNVIPNKVFMKGKGDGDVTVYIVSTIKKKIPKKIKKEERNAAFINRRVSFNPSYHGSYLLSGELQTRNFISSPKGKNGIISGSGPAKLIHHDSQIEEDSQIDNNSIQLDYGAVENSFASQNPNSQSMLADANAIEAREEALKPFKSSTLAKDDQPAIISKITEGDKEDIYLDDTLDVQQESEIFNNHQKKKFFERKILAEYSSSINFALCLLIADIFLRELFIWIDPKAEEKFQYFRFLNIIVAIFILVLVILKQLQDALITLKIMICLAIFLRTTLQVIEYFVVYYSAYLLTATRRYRLPQIFDNVIWVAIIDLTFLVSFGIFYFRSILIINLLVGVLVIFFYIYFGSQYSFTLVFALVATVIFNLMDTYKVNKREVMVMFKIIKTKKESTYLSKFVDRLLPKHIQDVNRSENMIAETYRNVTILFADIVGFTKYSADKEPRQVIEMLSKLFTDFDQECNRLNLFKVYTIGDCYVVMGFIDKKNRKPPQEEANDVVQLAICMIQIIRKVKKQINFPELNMRIGIHTGNIFGGVIGTEIVRFDIYGPDVLIANKMESGGEPGYICVSQSTKDLLESLETTNYSFEDNKVIKIKSLAMDIPAYFLHSDLLKEEDLRDDSFESLDDK